MEAVSKGGKYELINPRSKEVVAEEDAAEIFSMIVEHAWKNGDPGIVFIDRINRDNPTPNMGEIESTNPCVTGDALVSTEYGLMRMKDLAELYPSGGISVFSDEAVLEANGGNTAVAIRRKCKLTEISAAFKSGIRKVYRITTGAGYEIEVTDDHKIYTARGWVRAGELKVGEDRVFIQPQEGYFGSDYSLPFEVVKEVKGKNGRTYRSRLPEKWSVELAELLGYAVGDGWLIENGGNKRFGLTFGSGDMDVMSYFMKIMGSFYGREIKPVKRKDSVYHLSYHSGLITDFFSRLGLSSEKAGDKTVPEGVFRAPGDIVRGFLRGLFSADGTIADAGGSRRYVRLASKSLKLLKDTQRLLLNLGIISRIYDRSRPERTGFKYTDKSGKKKEYKLDGILYELNISRQSMKRFLESVGFLNERHKKT
ncbi:MAG TPA: LAGLIDADG family homing endonuclease, partial [Candidatus Goldiibacteriota bacterium]|nr:LAGLIDADG family homing endonuclease [Candidatus Goldiibacteriota bacterium]